MEIDKLSKLLSTGEYTIGDVHFSNHCENTRFVIIEKYPERDKCDTLSDNEMSVKTLYMNIEIKQTVRQIETTFTIDKNGKFTYGV